MPIDLGSQGPGPVGPLGNFNGRDVWEGGALKQWSWVGDQEGFSTEGCYFHHTRLSDTYGAVLYLGRFFQYRGLCYFLGITERDVTLDASCLGFIPFISAQPGLIVEICCS